MRIVVAVRTVTGEKSLCHVDDVGDMTEAFKTVRELMPHAKTILALVPKADE